MSLTREQARRLDQAAEQVLGLPVAVLMENAALGAADIARGLLLARAEGGGSHARVAVVCGGGNNGGDGWALARHLFVAGLEVGVFAVVPAERLHGAALMNARAAAKLGIGVSDVSAPEAWAEHLPALQSAALVVDAVLGTGFGGGAGGPPAPPVRPAEAEAIRMMNLAALGCCAGNGACGCASRAGKPQPETRSLARPWLLALDLPSGLDADSGQPADPCVQAHATVTFADRKAGFDAPGAAAFTGEVFTAPIGVPLRLAQA